MAQLVEQLTRNEQVVRSSRISSSTSEWTLPHSDFSYVKNQSYAPSFLLFRKKARSRDVGDAIPYDISHIFRLVVGGGSRLPTRSNRKTIATGNLRPRHPVRC